MKNVLILLLFILQITIAKAHYFWIIHSVNTTDSTVLVNCYISVPSCYYFSRQSVNASPNGDTLYYNLFHLDPNVPNCPQSGLFFDTILVFPKPANFNTYCHLVGSTILDTNTVNPGFDTNSSFLLYDTFVHSLGNCFPTASNNINETTSSQVFIATSNANNLNIHLKQIVAQDVKQIKIYNSSGAIIYSTNRFQNSIELNASGQLYIVELSLANKQRTRAKVLH